MWRDYPFSQRNKTTKKALGAEFIGDEEGVIGKKLKMAQAIQGDSP